MITWRDIGISYQLLLFIISLGVGPEGEVRPEYVVPTGSPECPPSCQEPNVDSEIFVEPSIRHIKRELLF